jgi:hypothetical protein
VTRHDSRQVTPFGHPGITARLTAPPGLSRPPTSFIGPWYQGIHRPPLPTSPHTTHPKTNHKHQRCSRPLCKSQPTTHPQPHHHPHTSRGGNTRPCQAPKTTTPTTRTRPPTRRQHPPPARHRPGPHHRSRLFPQNPNRVLDAEPRRTRRAAPHHPALPHREATERPYQTRRHADARPASASTKDSIPTRNSSPLRTAPRKRSP